MAVSLHNVTTAVSKAAIKWRAPKRGNSGLPRHDPTMVGLRKLCLECGPKESVHSVQSPSSDAQETGRTTFKIGTKPGASSRLKGAPPPTRAPILENLGTDGKMDRIHNLQRRTDIVHDSFKELFTDPLHWESLEWIWQRWPREVVQSRKGNCGGPSSAVH